MKRLTLIRHAKSSWDDPGLADYERPLNKRGLKDAPLMGGILSERIPAPHCVVTSPAVRARSTTERITEAMGVPAEAIAEDDRIYAADVTDLVAVIREFDEAWQHVFLVGHCPSMLDLTNWLCGDCVEKMPTCGIALVQVPVKRWAAVKQRSCRLDEFLYPKLFK